MTAEVTAAYKGVSTNILKATKDARCGLRVQARPSIRNFGQLIAYVADAQMAICGAAKGEMKRGDAAKKTSKAELVAALKASSEVCDNAYSGMTDAQGVIIVDTKLPLGGKSKLACLISMLPTTTRCTEPSGLSADSRVIVPPSTETAAAARQAK